MGFLKRMWDSMGVPRWQRYKDFFQITIFRYLVLWFSLVPTVAGLVSGLPEPLPVTIQGQTYLLSLKLPFSWQILWLASLCFFLAISVYYFFCPKFIKQYNNYAEYLSYSHDPRWLAWEAKGLLGDKDALSKLVSRLSVKQYLTLEGEAHKGENPFVDTSQTKFYFSHAGQHYMLAMPILDSEGAISKSAEVGVFWEIFGRHSESKFLARLVVLLSLLASGLLFLYVLFEHIVSGLVLVCKWLAGS